MSDESLLFIAVFVFLLMIIGLIMTAVEFRYGAPRRQAREKRRHAQSEAHNRAM
ncbi:MAG: hypothetical protein PVF28_07295 [Thioalkalispiraceae bacterium]|jgi:hypothetical protein